MEKRMGKSRMSKGPARFTQADVIRAIRAAQRAGAGDVIVAPDGSIRIATKPGPLAERAPVSEDDRLDRELAQFEAEHG
jgi:hypothetical protein